MFFKKDPKKVTFYGIAMALILLGIFIFSFGCAAWVIAMITHFSCTAFPSMKIIGGTIIISLGYILLELEFIRHKD